MYENEYEEVLYFSFFFNTLYLCQRSGLDKNSYLAKWYMVSLE